MGKLEHKIAVVTGAGRGIGREISLAFGREGADVCLVSRTLVELQEVSSEIASLGGSHLTMVADVTNGTEVEQVVAAVLEKYGRIDILVNNAGVLTPIGPLWENDPEEWLSTIRTNVGGVFFFCRAVLPVMIKQGAGRIVNLSGGGDGALPNLSAYSASKAAVARLTETLAAELTELNICVNAIAPGPVRTRMTEQIIDAGSKAGLKLAQEASRTHALRADAKRATELAVFLASDESKELSGRLLSANWDDWSSLPERMDEVMASNMYQLRRVGEQAR